MADGFYHNFSGKLSPGPKNGKEGRIVQFSTICAKIQALNLIIDKLAAILRFNYHLLANPSCTKFSYNQY
jgi:hypothetical protein